MVTTTVPSQQAVPGLRDSIQVPGLTVLHQEHSICAPVHSTAYISSQFCTSRTPNFYPISCGSWSLCCLCAGKQASHGAVSGTQRQAAPDVAQSLPVGQKYSTNLNQKSEFAWVISALHHKAGIFSDVVLRNHSLQLREGAWHRIHHVTKQHGCPRFILEGRALEYS